MIVYKHESSDSPALHHDDLHRIFAWTKCHWILLLLALVACKEVLETVNTSDTFSAVNRHIALNDSYHPFIAKYSVPPTGHPWHRWGSSSIDAKYLVEELSLIDRLSLDEELSDPAQALNDSAIPRDINTTFPPQYYRTLMPFVVRNGVAFHPKRKDTMVKTRRWQHLEDILVDALDLAHQLQHVPEIRAVANGSFPFILSHGDHTACNHRHSKEIPIFSWYAIADCDYSWPVPDYHVASRKKETPQEWEEDFATWNQEYP